MRRYLFLFLAAIGIMTGIWTSIARPIPLSQDLFRSLSGCARQGESSKDCLRTVAKRFVSRSSAGDILSALEELEKEPAVFDVCHEFAHYVGQEVYQKTGDVRGTIQAGAHVCYGGYYHGVMERFLGKERLKGQLPTREGISSLVAEACGKKEQYNKPILYTECIHGVGHGMMLLSSGNLPQALSLCDGLESLPMQEECFGGVFMENSTSTTTAGHASQWVKQNDPAYPCTILDTRYKASCYMYQSTFVAKKTGDAPDWDAVSRFCASVPLAYQEGCFFVVGTNLPSATAAINEYWDVCRRLPATVVSTCVRGVVVSLSGWHLPDTSGAVSFCSLVDQEQKAVCFSQLGSSIKEFTSESARQKELCATVPTSAQTQCEQGSYK